MINTYYLKHADGTDGFVFINKKTGISEVPVLDI